MFMSSKYEIVEINCDTDYYYIDSSLSRITACLSAPTLLTFVSNPFIQSSTRELMTEKIRQIMHKRHGDKNENCKAISKFRISNLHICTSTMYIVSSHAHVKYTQIKGTHKTISYFVATIIFNGISTAL